jgi:hypothetical protein
MAKALLLYNLNKIYIVFIKILFNHQGECVIRANGPDTPTIQLRTVFITTQNITLRYWRVVSVQL